MRRKLTDFVGVLVLIVIVVCSVGAVSDLLENKESDRRYASFFTEEQAVDVLLIGSSHIRHGVFPMELWRTRGIAAYNLAGNGCTIPSAYWVLVNALDYRVPEVVVMDVFDMWPGRIVSDRYGHVHDQFDAFPLSLHKAQMVLDLFRDPALTDRNGNSLYEKRWEFFWNLGEYHSRWASLGKEDFAGERAIEERSRVWKGAEPLSGVVERREHKYKKKGDGGLPVYDEQSRQYLEKMIDLCDDRGIRLILVNTGFDCSDEAKLFHDSVVDIAADNGVPYYDFTKEDFIDFGTDLNSTGHNTHVNFSGAEKMSERVGDILAEEGCLQDHRGDAAYEQWRADCEAFIAGKHEYLKEQEDLENYLMFLYDDDYRVMFDIREDSLLEEEKLKRLVENLGERVEAWSADEWDEVDWGAEALDSMALESEALDPETEDTADLIIAVYSKHDGKVVDVRSFKNLSVVP